MSSYTKKNPRILTFCNYYIPGYKAGGPIRTISNMVELLGDHFDFYIVTGDRDSQDEEPYAHLKNTKGWQEVGKAKVLYLAPEEKTLVNIWRVIKNTQHSFLYLNSSFNYNFSLKPLLLRRLSLIHNKPTILAPRGELSEGALNLKSRKKRLFLTVSRLLGLYQKVFWHVSSIHEKCDVLREVKNITSDKIHIALNLPDISSLSKSLDFVARKRDEPLRVVFLSRIHPMKNLDYAIDVLKLSGSKIKFDVFGLIANNDYYDKCMSDLENKNSNVNYRYHGSVVHDEVVNIFSKYDLMILPTKGENYGHVILEALSAGTPALISDATPWQDLEEKQAGWAVPLDSKVDFVEKIRYMAELDEEQQLLKRRKAQEYARYHLLDENNVQKNIELFNL